VAGPAIGGPNVSAAEFFYGDAGCGPRQVIITVGASDAGGVAWVRIHFRLLNKASNAATAWTYLEMAQGDGAWTRTIEPAADIPGHNAYVHAWFQFYFVAANAAGGQTKSPGYWTGFTLSRCVIAG